MFWAIRRCQTGIQLCCRIAINVPEPTHTDGLDCKSTLNPDAYK